MVMHVVLNVLVRNRSKMASLLTVLVILPFVSCKSDSDAQTGSGGAVTGGRTSSSGGSAAGGTPSTGGVSTSGDFGQTNTCGNSLGAGARCTIQVAFTPTAAGQRTGNVSIADNAPNSP